MTKHIRHLRHHARKHEEAHLKLKDLLGKILHKEKIWGIFLITFSISILTLLIFLNWGKIVSFLATEKEEEVVHVEEPFIPEGFKKGLLSAYAIHTQVSGQYRQFIQRIPTEGAMIALETSRIVGHSKEERTNEFLSSIYLSTHLSKGFHLTPQKTAKNLQKSLLTSFYLGEKAIDLNSTLQKDADLLSRINNALSVDIFVYLNQSVDRADSLDSFLNLLRILETAAQERSADLSSQINFLNANFQAQEQSIEGAEEDFFESLQMFAGEDAEQQLSDFIGLQKDQTEVRAKRGVYQSLQEYYEFFLPKLDNLIRAIGANRDPLIAGVKVVEIQNMTLPLIIRER